MKLFWDPLIRFKMLCIHRAVKTFLHKKPTACSDYTSTIFLVSIYSVRYVFLATPFSDTAHVRRTSLEVRIMRAGKKKNHSIYTNGKEGKPQCALHENPLNISYKKKKQKTFFGNSSCLYFIANSIVVADWEIVNKNQILDIFIGTFGKHVSPINYAIWVHALTCYK